MQLPEAREFGSADVIATTYHTVDSTTEHAEGEEYTVTDYALLETLVGCGFVDLVSQQPK